MRISFVKIKIRRRTRTWKWILYWKDDSIKVNKVEEIFLRQETAAAILENKQIHFPKPYYKENNLLQAPVGTESEKQKKHRGLFKTCTWIFCRGLL